MEQTNDSRDQFEQAQAAHRHVDGACCSHCEHDCAPRRDANRTRDWAYSHAIIAAPRAATGTPVNNTVDAAAGYLNQLERQHSASRTQQAPAPATTHQPRENAVPRDQHPDQLAPIDAGRQEHAAAGTPLPGIAAIMEGAGVPTARDGQALVRPADVQIEHRTLDPGLRLSRYCFFSHTRSRFWSMGPFEPTCGQWSIARYSNVETIIGTKYSVCWAAMYAQDKSCKNESGGAAVAL
jgi:hypothetical protein